MTLIDELNREIKANRLIMRKLMSPLKTLEQRAARQKQKRKEHLELLTGFRDLEEARTAWGMGWISRKEFGEIEEMFVNGKGIIDQELSAEEIAHNILFEFYKKVSTQELRLNQDLIAEQKKMKGGEKI